MRAIVTVPFPGRPDREIMTRNIAVGEEIEGDLARVAVANEWASEIKVEGDSADSTGSSIAPGEGLDALTVAQLIELAKANGIDVSTAKKKADYLALLQAPE